MRNFAAFCAALLGLHLPSTISNHEKSLSLDMSITVRLKKGLDLQLVGGIDNISAVTEVTAADNAIFPDDFPGFEPKLDVKEGQSVALGEPLLHDKRDERIKLVSPVEGKVKAVVRGERRHIERIVIEPAAAAAADARPLSIEGISRLSADEARTELMQRGLWALMRQRPYDIVPEPDIAVRDIFITAFDSAPLADNRIDYSAQELQAGIAMLGKLTAGKIYLSRRPNAKLPSLAGVEDIVVEGPHPAGNVGVQIANIAPVNKGEAVITLDITSLGRIGRTLLSGSFDNSACVALTGSEVAEPQLIKTTIGADIASTIKGRLKTADHHQRIISGNVLTGIKVSTDSYLHFPWRQLTVIAEGDDVDEFMGWASLSPKKMSQSRSFLSWLFGPKKFNPDARLLGGRRALILSEQYERLMPMDIVAEYLLKAIIGRDIEKMEQLGIYEVAPEDFALGEWADASKIPAQQIVREGLDYLRKELR